ncbi:MAG: flagellar motor protein MotB [Acidobacteria bacterium]|nr:MAG: flagellar motor protein MotB [Acidobacteriota bacterium]
MRHEMIFLPSILLLLSSLNVVRVAQQDQVEPMEKTPVFRANVVSRTTKAVDYRHRGGSTRVDLRGTELMPQAAGEAKVESKTGRLEIDAKLSGMEPANKFGLEYLTYVLWAITPEGRANNLGEVVLDNGKSEMHATTDLQAFGLIVTAEPYFAVTQPSDLVVAENIVRRDTKGREEAINVKYELLPKGLYASQVEPLRDVVYGIDSKAPLDLFEARNAIRIARAAKADQYASSSFAKAEADLKQAEDYYRRKQGRTPIGTVAREAIQTAEEARVMSLKRQEEERIANEREAAAAREAQAKADAEAQAQRRVQAETERASAEQAKAEAERARQESDLAAQKAAQEKQEAQAAQAAALAQQQALQAENEKARSQAEESERGRQKAESEKAEMRARLLQQLNAVLVTRDTARGLIATMPDVLFETNQYALRPAARESLAKVAGILLAYPDLRLEVDGHTDSVGSDAYNQQLSEKRAASVRDYLAQQRIPIASVTVQGFGKTQPVASNATASGRQQNRRVELVVSGEVIGTKIGGTSSTVPTPPQP